MGVDDILWHCLRNVYLCFCFETVWKFQWTVLRFPVQIFKTNIHPWGEGGISLFWNSFFRDHSEKVLDLQNMYICCDGSLKANSHISSIPLCDCWQLAVECLLVLHFLQQQAPAMRTSEKFSTVWNGTKSFHDHNHFWKSLVKFDISLQGWFWADGVWCWCS